MSEASEPVSTGKEILVVDDTPASLRLMSELLTRHGYRVRPATNGTLALKSVAAKTPDLILLDVSMPGMDGYEVCRRLKADEKSSRIPVIFISAFGDTQQKVTGFEAGGIDYIAKPVEAEEVLARVRTHLRLRQAEEALRDAHNTLELRVQERTAELQSSNQALRESEEKARQAFDEIQRLKTQLEMQNAYLQEEVIEAKAFGDLIGQSAALRQVVSQVDLVAPTDASVLILGETGTGKELVAHEIHRRSRRKDKPFVRVNCASIPKDLYESEFFGHARGSFTGAVKDRAGRFESAEGGTIFLDEIGEVPLDLQSKLLRVLQEKSYERVGEDRTRYADVRIIAATNRELKQEAAAGRFREDFYYRLNVFPIQVAPLRERREDIPLLAQHFIKLSVKEMGCAKPRLTRAGIIQLQSYDWPGNIRELRNVIERAVILSRGKGLEFDLPSNQRQPAIVEVKSRLECSADAGYFTEAEMLQKERDNLARVLQKANWKIKGADGAAELLGIKPNTLLARIKKLGLKR
ncbi:MAG TPA: sigma-54 dependent transcriptional regulator [Candidatus Acidoferrum sp.]|nr:sigma-54 dependent transcriptional regulator [Candidatus Acidoferrum sp.]